LIIVELLLANHHRQKRLKRPDNTNYYLSKDELTCELRKAHFSSTGNDASSMIIGKASNIPTPKKKASISLLHVFKAINHVIAH
jgi:hypothetical protein